MKNLINTITKEERKRLEDFIFSINQLTELKQLGTWQYNDLLPKGKKVDNFSFNALKGYLIMRKEKAVNKAIERQVNRIKVVMAAKSFETISVSVEWKKSRTWGANPKAEAWLTGKEASNYSVSSSISGCGYDKLSTAVAESLNQFNEVLRLMYIIKDKALEADKKANNRDIFGYGSGYGILPAFEGGVGVSCYPKIFEKLGYKFENVASGKTFDVFKITKL